MKGRFRLGGLIVLVAGTALSAGQTPQPAAQQTPTFKAQVEYVEVDAIVTNQQGQFVRDLAREDFRVLEDGKPQTITAFTVVDIPVERYDRPLFASQPIEPDVKTNERPFDGRVYVMVIDDLHTEVLRSQRVKAAAKQFIELRLGANDLMAVVHTAGPSNASQEFTSNKRLLLAAVDRTQGRKLESATLNRTNEYYRAKDFGRSSDRIGDRINDPEDFERAYNARSTLQMLKSVAEWFASVHGRRKAILFVSEGIDYDIYDLFTSDRVTITGASSIIDATRDAIDAAMRANVSIYGIDPRGLTNLGDKDITVLDYPNDTKLGVGFRSLLSELRLSQDSLRVLSEDTGGFATVNRNEFSSAYERIVADNSSYYVLAYYPPSVKRDGKFHKIDVRVTRPGLTVRARRGYLSPKGKPAAPPPPSAGRASVEIREALSSPLPVSGLTMRLFAAPFKGTAPNASVLLGVEMVGRALTLTPNNKVEVSYMAVDSAGKVHVAKDDRLTLNLQPKTQGRVEQNGLRMLKRIDLPPGRYQLRVAGHDVAGGAVGSVIYDLEVPDFNKLHFSMSSLVLTSIAGSAMVTTGPDEQLKDVLPAPPVALRTFPQNDEPVLFTEVYDNGATSPHRVDIVTTVVSDEGKVLFKTEEDRASSELQGSRGGYGYVARVPLKDLPPGSYVLKVEARSRLGEGAVASRQVQFKVTPPETAPAR